MNLKSMFFVILVCVLITISLDARPVLLVTHPSASFLRSYLHLVEKDLFPKCDLLIMAHESQKKEIKNAHNILGNSKHIKYEFRLLHGYPTDNRFDNSWEKKVLFPNPNVKRFSTHSDAKIPVQWYQTFIKLFRLSDGCILPGGADIPAAAYGNRQFIENNAPTALRSTFELAFLRFLLNNLQTPMIEKPRYMILGICLGSQSMNVASGGSMWQSIPVEIYGIKYLDDMLKLPPDLMHKNYYLMKYPPIEKVYVGWFHKIMSTSTDKHFGSMKNVQVLSNHHQAVRTLGKGLNVTATNLDGKIVEMFNHKIFPNVIGVQFHPEREYYWDKLPILTNESRVFLVKFWKRMSYLIKQNKLLRDYKNQ